MISFIWNLLGQRDSYVEVFNGKLNIQCDVQKWGIDLFGGYQFVNDYCMNFFRGIVQSEERNFN